MMPSALPRYFALRAALIRLRYVDQHLQTGHRALAMRSFGDAADHAHEAEHARVNGRFRHSVRRVLRALRLREAVLFDAILMQEHALAQHVARCDCAEVRA